jgi:type II secretory pathway pseudopilin PulG
MKPLRGFTLVEMAVTIGLIIILAAITVAGTRAMQSNATLAGTVFELQLLAQGQPALALTEQRDRVLILVNGNGSGCTIANDDGCTHFYLVAAPDPAVPWILANFDPKKPGANTREVVDQGRLEKVFLYDAGGGKAGPPPFNSVKTFDPLYSAKCGGSLCVAFRFRANGEVLGEFPDGVGTQARGNAVVFSTDLQGETGAADRRVMLVGFPNGIVKTYPY